MNTLVGKPVSAPERLGVQLRILARTFKLGLEVSGSLLKALSATLRLWREHTRTSGWGIPSNLCRVDGRYFLNLNTPGFPSIAFDRILRQRVAETLGHFSMSGLFVAFVAVTKKCRLNCEHCFEWEALDQAESLGDEDIFFIIQRVIDLGAGQIVLTGGEPLNRFATLIRILDLFGESGVEFWINTSGMGLSEERAIELKRHGLTGIVVSLDHHIESEHDRFRGRKGCFRAAVFAAGLAQEGGLVTALSLCPTNDFISTENLDAYMDLARDLKVSFVRIVEPKPVGRYAQSEVALTGGKRRLLELFSERFDGNRRELRSFPVINYPDYSKRQEGCVGGKRYLYVDTEGNVSPCPFCKATSVRIDQLDRANLSGRLTCPA
ncbi:MAG: radical SAM protein [Opitutaceae bacterium]